LIVRHKYGSECDTEEVAMMNEKRIIDVMSMMIVMNFGVEVMVFMLDVEAD
jgi:hypothetical protein